MHHEKEASDCEVLDIPLEDGGVPGDTELCRIETFDEEFGGAVLAVITIEGWMEHAWKNNVSACHVYPVVSTCRFLVVCNCRPDPILVNTYLVIDFVWLTRSWGRETRRWPYRSSGSLVCS